MTKGQSQYLSWIIILALVVGISYMLYNWSLEQAQSTADQIDNQADPLACEEASLMIEGSCQDFHNLRINVSNQNPILIDGLLIRTTGLYPEDSDYLSTLKYENTIDPGDDVRIAVLKQGTLSQAVVVPIVRRRNAQVFCENKRIILEIDELKQC